MIRVRPAASDDAAAMSAVLIASIRELCVEDHHNIEKVVAGWTANKTPEGVVAMLADAGAQGFVAEVDGAVAAVGMVLGDGSIGLNYVSPAFRFQGVSRALLAHMEGAIKASGRDVAMLMSTATAHRFYQEAGWIDAGPPQQGFTLIGYPMRKAL
jgi:GNAT superfamily N-acetyltransferase